MDLGSSELCISTKESLVQGVDHDRTLRLIVKTGSASLNISKFDQISNAVTPRILKRGQVIVIPGGHLVKISNPTDFDLVIIRQITLG